MENLYHSLSFDFCYDVTRQNWRKLEVNGLPKCIDVEKSKGIGTHLCAFCR